MTVVRLCDAVTFELIEPHIALVSIDRPAARNAVNVAVAEGLTDAIRRVEDDPDIWVAVLTGAGTQAFSAGADLKAMSAGALGRVVHDGFPFVHTPRTKPWIAAVNGLAVAGGFEMALACDMIVAAEGAWFALPEVKRGLIAAAGGAYRIARLVPRQLATELVLTGDRLSAERAQELGFINRIAPEGKAVAVATGLAREVCVNAPIAVRESLAIVKRALDESDAELRDLSHEAQRRIVETEDFVEGPRAFVDKRQPIWLNR